MEKDRDLINRADRKARIEFFDHGNGFYSFEETEEAVDDHPQLGPLIYWRSSHLSGLYASRAAAERDARSMIPWLRAVDASEL